MQEAVEMKGALFLLVQDREGRVIRSTRYPNLIVNSGRELVASLFASGVNTAIVPAPVTHMAVGTDASEPRDNQSKLEAEVKRAVITEAKVAPKADGSPGYSVQLTASFDYEDDIGEALQEAGIFTHESDGVMYNRVVFPPIIKTDKFKLTLMWEIDF